MKTAGEAQSNAGIEALRATHDAHCHLDFMSNGEQVAADARAKGMRLFACTVEPEGYRVARERFTCFENVHVGLGMHPWWVPQDARFDQAAEAAFDELFEELLAETRFVGEVGLDFGKRGAENREGQVRRFAKIAALCADQGDKVLSMHAVKSADAVLDALEAANTLRTCTCIFHWFSASSVELTRAKQAGCLFSVNPMMAAAKRGREYIKAIPAKQLLLETDAPPGQGVSYSFESLEDALVQALETIAELKGAHAADVVADNARRVFGQ